LSKTFSILKRTRTDAINVHGTQQAIEYCKKDGDYLEAGSRRIQGERTDLLKTKTQIKEGISLSKIFDSNDIQNSSQIKVIENYATYFQPKNRTKPKVYWIYGETGMGKTKWPTEQLKNIFWKDKTKWWDGYDKQETNLMDDFRGSQMKFSELLSVLDRYPKRVEVNGSYRWLGGNNVMITSNKHPNKSHQLPDEDIKQLIRRIDYIIEFTPDNSIIRKDPFTWLGSRDNTRTLLLTNHHI
jgi:hypothetical protein